jgi:hypothetical protein
VDVFNYVANLENWPRWQSDMQSSVFAEGQPGQVGAVDRYLSKAMPSTRTVHCRLGTLAAVCA